MSDPAPAPTPIVGPRGLVVFDGDCGFCRRWINNMNTWFRRRPDCIPWQQADLKSLGLTADQCMTAVQFVGHDMRTWSGSDAAARILIVAGLPYGIAGRAMLVPGMRSVAGAAYRWVAANRHRFRGDAEPR